MCSECGLEYHRSVSLQFRNQHNGWYALHDGWTYEVIKTKCANTYISKALFKGRLIKYRYNLKTEAQAKGVCTQWAN